MGSDRPRADDDVLPNAVRAALACVRCVGPLADAPDGLACTACGQPYLRVGRSIDLRLREPMRVTIEHVVRATVAPPDGHRDQPSPDVTRRLHARPDSPHDPNVITWTSRERHGCRMTPDLFTHVPNLPPGGGLLIDLGAGEQVYRTLLSSTGFDYVSVDTSGTVDILADAHRLPFASSSAEVVVAISLLEHVYDPFVAMREVARVLRPGGTVLGSVALTEPFHMNSYFHHSHLGVAQVLEVAGLEPVVIALADDWPSIHAVAEMGLFEGAPRVGARLVTWPLRLMGRAWWRARAVAGRAHSAGLDRDLLLTAGFRFVARRPVA